MEGYIAFYVAGFHDKIHDIYCEFIGGLLTPGQTIAFEKSKDSHLAVNGEHCHFLCKWSDIKFKAFMRKLKASGVDMRGRAEPNAPRTYGRVKHIRDFKRMLAYTIKGGNYSSGEPPELLEECSKISFEKEETITSLRHRCMEYLDKEIKWELREPKPAHLRTFDEPSDWIYPHGSNYTPLAFLKLKIIDFYLANPQYKMPSKSQVTYLAQYYCMYYKNIFKNTQLLHIFF